MTSQTGRQTITMHMLLDISRSKGNQKMELYQVIKYNVINIFHEKSCNKWGRETSSRPRFVFHKALFGVKAIASTLVSICFGNPRLTDNKQKLYETSDYWFRDMLNFDFLKKSLGLASSPHFLHDFWRKIFLLTDRISLSDCLYFWRYLAICLL